ncbi:hypothetical protein [Arsenicicoccus sp. oral taxon 190]|uniref:hypothetical protein n=1 Tax=Arsenicicoccus sp. oral taxon 190 TaxID=1658671 RepID=UPI0012E2DA0F|nr:hypothetical protein [Arsenicicoccus sp. oral taxon 190]
MITQLQVALRTGVTYDVFGYTGEQVCHDVLDHYERYAHARARTAPEVEPV